MNKDFRIKNYKTGVGWERTIGEIEGLLVAIGADAVLKNYRGDGRIEALSFKFQGRGYRLPGNSDKIAELLKGYPGFKNATQQRRASLRAELPYGLSLAMCKAVEMDMEEVD